MSEIQSPSSKISPYSIKSETDMSSPAKNDKKNTPRTPRKLSLARAKTPRKKGPIRKPRESKPPATIQFDAEGLPLATIENLNALSLDDLEKYCQKGWVLQKHIDPLLIKLDLPTSGAKADKCKRLLKYKKDHPTTQARKTVIYNNSYESFNWRKETDTIFRGQHWILPFSSGFRTHIMSQYSDYRLESDTENKINPDQDKSLFKYQGFTKAYLHPRTPYRSELAFHGLGSGKTRNAIELSTEFIKDGKKILVMLPGSLRFNFMEQLYQWGIPEIRIPNYDQLGEEARKAKEKTVKKVIDHYYDILTYNEGGLLDKLKKLTNPETGLLENRLIIVDEEHRFISRLSKEANIGRKIYYFLMDRLVNCKLLFLSGTPLINQAYELGLLFNILRGKFSNGLTLFPENEEEFNEKFVNLMDRSVLNRELFKRRISGLVSYFSGTFDPSIDGNPKKVIHPIMKIPMSDHQYGLYLSERFDESKKEPKSTKKTQNSNVSPRIGSSFRTYSRMVCNFAFPAPDIQRPKPISGSDYILYQKFAGDELDPHFASEVMDEIVSPDQEEGEPDPNYVDDSQLHRVGKTLSKGQRAETYAKMLQFAVENLRTWGPKVFSNENLKIYSPKMLAIIRNIESGPGSQGLVYIYTEFRMLEGVTIMGIALEHRGYEKMDYSKIRSFNDIKKAGKRLRYGVISGDEDIVARKILLSIFRHPENAHGEYIKVVLGTAASSEGISLKRVTQVHIMEPYWTLVRNDQVIGRAIRIKSHLDLPNDEQVVHVFRYQMALTERQRAEIVSQLEDVKENLSTDEYVHKVAVDKDKINQQFIQMIQEAAVDCGLNYLQNVQATPELKCMEVPPEIGPYLYYPDINKDPEDKEYLKKLKHESYAVQTKVIGGFKYAFKVNLKTGKPIFDPPSITYKGKVYHSIITLYDADLLEQGIEIRKKYLVLGTHLMIDAGQVRG